METTELIAYIAAATTPIGDDLYEWKYQAGQKAATIMAELGDPTRNPIAERINEIVASKPIRGTLIRVAPSTGGDKRGVLTIYTGTDRTEDGTEQLRTEWYTNRRGADEVAKARAMMGHKVIAFKQTVTATNRPDTKIRMCRYLRDLGADQDWQVQTDAKGRPDHAVKTRTQGA